MYVKFFLIILIATLLGGNVTAESQVKFSPYFASLKGKLINTRVGPGKEYPFKWVYQRAQPVEVIAAFDDRKELWHKIRDVDGQESWVYHTMLLPARYVIVQDAQPLRKNPEKEAKPIATLEKGVIGKVLTCERKWCKVSITTPDKKTYKGWLPKKALWGVYPIEQF